MGDRGFASYSQPHIDKGRDMNINLTMKRAVGMGIFGSVAMLLAACNPVYYQPTPAVVPLLQEKGDLELQGSVADGVSFSVGGAYALSDQFALMAHGYLVPNSEGYSGGIAELGLGFNAPVGENLRFETYAGAGVGSLSADLETEEGSVDSLLFELGLSRLFLQPSIGYVSENFEAAVTTRFSVVNYSDIQRGPAASTSDARFATLEELDDQAAVFLEPGITLRAGTERVKGQLQYFHALRLAGDALEVDDNRYYENSVLSLGIVFKLPGGE